MKTIRTKLFALENTEMDLVHRLKHTRQNMVKVNQEYIAAKDNAYQSHEFRLATLKQKLGPTRSRYLEVNKSKF